MRHELPRQERSGDANRYRGKHADRNQQKQTQTGKVKQSLKPGHVFSPQPAMKLAGRQSTRTSQSFGKRRVAWSVAGRLVGIDHRECFAAFKVSDRPSKAQIRDRQSH